MSVSMPVDNKLIIWHIHICNVLFYFFVHAHTHTHTPGTGNSQLIKHAQSSNNIGQAVGAQASIGWTKEMSLQRRLKSSRRVTCSCNKWNFVPNSRSSIWEASITECFLASCWAVKKSGGVFWASFVGVWLFLCWNQICQIPRCSALCAVVTDGGQFVFYSWRNR